MFSATAPSARSRQEQRAFQPQDGKGSLFKDLRHAPRWMLVGGFFIGVNDGMASCFIASAQRSGYGRRLGMPHIGRCAHTPPTARHRPAHRRFAIIGRLFEHSFLLLSAFNGTRACCSPSASIPRPEERRVPPPNVNASSQRGLSIRWTTNERSWSHRMLHFPSARLCRLLPSRSARQLKRSGLLQWPRKQ